MLAASAKCRAYIRAKEENALRAYRDMKGILTIGWGHTGPDVHEGMVIDMAQADELFRRDLAKAEAEVNRQVKVEITQGMFDGLVAFEYNTGGMLIKDKATGQMVPSGVCRAVNDRRWNDVVEELVRWNITGGQDARGLLIRRLEEGLMFTSHKYP